MARLTLGTDTLVEYPAKQFFGDLWRYLKGYRSVFFVASALGLLSDIAALYPAIAMASIVTLLTKPTPQTLGSVWLFVGLWVLALALKNAFEHASRYLAFQTSERIAVNAQIAAFAHLEKLDIGWHEQENSGSKLKRIERGGDSLDRLMRLWINSYIGLAVNILGSVVIITQVDGLVGTILAGFSVSFYILAQYLIRPVVVATRKVNIEEEHFTGLSFELINNIRTVKVLGMGRGFIRRLIAQGATLVAAARQRIVFNITRSSVLIGWSELARLTTAVVVIVNIVRGHYEVGFFVLAMNYFGRITTSIKELASNSQELAIARDGVARLQAIIRESVVIDSDEGKRAFPSNWRSIAVQSMAFAYGKAPVLNNISFEIQRGEKVGIVGPSGAGKSTLFKLLLKEHEGFRGSILVGQVPIQTITRSSYFAHTAVVLQETEVFNFSLKDNIVLADPDARSQAARLEQALTVAHVTDFIDKLPNGVDTLIGEKGFKLSGGEKQRLGIARAVFKQPEILFLDEATSHLDSESESKIQDSLHKFFRNVTAIVIAHRLSTIKQMDRILVLEKGKIVEEGSFNALYRKKGRFRDLWEKQKL